MEESTALRRAATAAGLLLTVAYVVILADVVLFDAAGITALRQRTRRRIEAHADTAAASRWAPAPADVSAVLAEATAITREAAAQ
jgi:hypothetical protein